MSAPTEYGSLSGPITGSSVVLVAQAAYHLDDLVPVREILMAQGIDAAIVCPLPRPSMLRRWRSSWWRHHELLAAPIRAGLTGSSPVPTRDFLSDAKALVVRNDWAVTRDLVEAAARAGVPTIGWVEGAQDFADADTGRARRAYRSVDHVLCLGQYDHDQLAGTDATIVGSERLWQAWHGAVTTADGPTVANVNFTYGVLENARNPWLDDVVVASQSCEQRVVLSRHPADRGRRRGRMEDRRPVDQLLARAPRLISRFSTLCYEALVRGVELTYHNPHGERVATFAEPGRAFQVTRTRSELVDVMSARTAPPLEVRERAEPFLRDHLVLDGPSPSTRAAARVAEVVG